MCYLKFIITMVTSIVNETLVHDLKVQFESHCIWKSMIDFITLALNIYQTCIHIL